MCCTAQLLTMSEGRVSLPVDSDPVVRPNQLERERRQTRKFLLVGVIVIIFIVAAITAISIYFR